jgi:hypothetical protein
MFYYNKGRKMTNNEKILREALENLPASAIATSPATATVT